MPYWKVWSVGLGYLAEAAAMGCCEAILSWLEFVYVYVYVSSLGMYVCFGGLDEMEMDKK